MHGSLDILGVGCISVHDPKPSGAVLEDKRQSPLGNHHLGPTQISDKKSDHAKNAYAKYRSGIQTLHLIFIFNLGETVHAVLLVRTYRAVLCEPLISLH